MDLKIYFLEFMNLNDINYKFMDQKMHFQSYGSMFSKFMDLIDTNYKLMDLKCTFKIRGPK